MSISVIIPTYNGSSKIVNLLGALAQQDLGAAEIIVVVDGSTDNTPAKIHNAGFKFQNLRILEQANMGRATARNNGAKAATNELLVFFDDDMIPEPGCVQRHVAQQANHPGSIVVGIARMHTQHDPKNDFFKYRFHIEENWQAPFKDKITRVSFTQFAFTTANMSVSKTVINALGAFDNRLNDSEDFDFCLKALQQNIPIYYDYGIWSWHCDYVNIGTYIKRQREYLQSKQDLAKIKPEYLQLHPASFSRANISPFKRFLSRFFRINGLWNAILRSRLFLKLFPQKMRFKLYEVIIFSSSIR